MFCQYNDLKKLLVLKNLKKLLLSFKRLIETKILKIIDFKL